MAKSAVFAARFRMTVLAPLHSRLVHDSLCTHSLDSRLVRLRPLVQVFVVEAERALRFGSATALQVRANLTAYLVTLPGAGVEEDIIPVLGMIVDPVGRRESRVLHHPLPQLLVPSPVAVVQLLRGQFLAEVTWKLVEDGEERVVGEGVDARFERRDVADGVSAGDDEFRNDGP